MYILSIILCITGLLGTVLLLLGLVMIAHEKQDRAAYVANCVVEHYKDGSPQLKEYCESLYIVEKNK